MQLLLTLGCGGSGVDEQELEVQDASQSEGTACIRISQHRFMPCDRSLFVLCAVQ